MGFWRRLFGGTSAEDLKPRRLDYLNEALALERQGDYDAALTSYRLAVGLWRPRVKVAACPRASVRQATVR